MPDRFDAGREGLDQVVPATDLWLRAVARAEPAVQPEAPERGSHRRRVASGVALLAAAVAAVGLLVAQRDDEPAGLAAFPTELPVPAIGQAAPERLGDGTPVWVVHHEDGTVSVLDAVSPHRPFGLGHLVGWCPSSRGFEDPQHGSQFDERGRSRGGPAPTAMAELVTERAGEGTVSVLARGEQPRALGDGERTGGQDCFDPNSEDPLGYNPGSLELHPLAADGGRSLADALGQPAGQIVVIRDAPLLLVHGQPTIACAGPLRESAPPSCDGAPVAGVELPADREWLVANGTFAARVSDGTLHAIAYTAGWTVEGAVPEQDCGSYVIPQGRFDDDLHAEEQQCLLDAFAAGEGARLSYEWPTIEGDPIFTHLRVIGPHLVEEVIDMRRDSFGTGGILVQRCSEIRTDGRRLQTGGCEAAAAT